MDGLTYLDNRSIYEMNNHRKDNLYISSSTNIKEHKIKLVQTYFNVASALSTVTESFVASRLRIPRSKYFRSTSMKGSISCEPIKRVDNVNIKISRSRKRKS